MVRLLGTLRQVEEKESKISARVSGRIEKVFIKHTGAFIKTGEAVIEIYSPQLISAGEEFIMAHRGKNRPIKELLRQSRERLETVGDQRFSTGHVGPRKRECQDPLKFIPMSRALFTNTVRWWESTLKRDKTFFELF